MKTIAVVNQKGGVGKTTIALHMAWYASGILGKRTLFVDLDGQGNTSESLMAADMNRDGAMTATVLFEKAPDGTPVEISRNLSLICASPGIDDVESWGLEVIHLPRAHINAISSDYDVCIIDTPPQRGRRILAALITADYAISPIFMDKFSIKGLTRLQESIIAVRSKYNPGLEYLGIIRNGLQGRSRFQMSLVGDLSDQLGNLVLPTYLRYSVPLADAINDGRPVWQKPKGGAARSAAREMKALMKDIFGGVEL